MSSAQRPALVLIVEDEPDLAHLVEVNLRVHGHRTLVAGDGAAGLEAARGNPVDLVLLDVMMPIMDGWKTLRALKEDPDLRDIPVIMLTALSQERDLIRGHLEGAVEYVTKPFDTPSLLEAVDQALEPPSDEERAARRKRTKRILTRLSELDSGRVSADPVRVSNLSPLPQQPAGRPVPTDAERARIYGLTPKQRLVASALANGVSARDLAAELGVSRSNVYATRKRIARRLGVDPEKVPDESRRLGIDGPPN